MHCQEIEPLMDGYIDGELDLERNLQLENHFETCEACQGARRAALELRSAIKENAPYFRAPQELQQRVRAIARKQGRTASRNAAPAWQWMAVAAAVVLIVLAGAGLGRNWLGPSHEELVRQQVVSGHIRSLMAAHLFDVASTDQHTVKPWFDGKIDFAPPVVDLAPAGFPLVGGRLDYADGRPVAALVYQHRLHYINLFIWPSAERQSPPAAAQVRDGYNVVHWTDGAMTFWAVSDVAGDDLESFARQMRK